VEVSSRGISVGSERVLRSGITLTLPKESSAEEAVKESAGPHSLRFFSGKAISATALSFLFLWTGGGGKKTWVLLTLFF